MSTKIGTLEIQLLANVAKLQADMDQAKGVVGSAMENMTKSIEMVKSALGGLGAVTTIAGFGELINKTIESTAELYKMHERTGVTVESLSALRSAAKLSGTDMSDAATALQKLSKNMVEAESGTGKAAATFKALGVSTKDQSGAMKSADQVMLDVAKSMQGFEEGAALTTAQMNLFGKAGANLAPMLVELAERGNLNGKVTTEQAKQAHEFEQSQIKLNMAVQGVFKSIAMDLIPVIYKLTDLIRPAITVTGIWFAGMVAVPAALAVAKPAFDAWALSIYEGNSALAVFNLSMGATVTATQAAIVQFGILKSSFMLLLSAFAGWEFGTWLRDNFVEAQLAGIAFVKGTLLGWENVKYAAGVAWAAIATGWSSAMSGMGEVLATFLDYIAGGLSKLGLGEASSKMLQWAASMRSASEGTTTLASRLAVLDAEHAAASKSISDITDDMADEAIAAFQSAEAHKARKKELDAGGLGKVVTDKDPAKAIMMDRIKNQEILIAAEKAGVTDQMKWLDDAYKLEYATLRETEEKKQAAIYGSADILKGAYDKEIAAVKAYIAAGKALSASGDSAEKNKGNAMQVEGGTQLAEVQGKKAAAIVAANAAITNSILGVLAVQRQFDLATDEKARKDAISNTSLQFQIDLMGKGTLETLKANNARQIQLDLSQRIFDLMKKDPTADTSSAITAAAIQTAKSNALIEESYNKQRSAIMGISNALNKYQEAAGFTAVNIENSFTNAFKGMEDALVNFVTTGKLDFSSLVNSMISDLVRYQIQQSVMKPLAAAMGSGGGFGGMISMLGFASGGQPPVGVPSIVGEKGPEIFVPSTAGTIVPNHALGGSNVTVNVIEDSSKAGTQQQRTTSGGGNVIDVFVAQVKAAIASDISRGSGAIPGAMQQTYGLNRFAGSY